MTVSRAQEPNKLWLDTEPLNRQHLEKYKSKRLPQLVYEAAAKLWADGGLEWAKALDLVDKSFRAVAEEP